VSVLRFSAPDVAGYVTSVNSEEMMTKKLIAVAAILLGSGIAHAQDLPPSARKALDKRFPHWHFRPSHIPNPCDIPGEQRPSFKPVSKCNLNGDGIPDYVVAITKGRNSSLVEYFIALVSNGLRYDLNLFDTARIHEGAGQRMFMVISAGDTMAIFGDGDTLVYNYSTSFGHNGITFPTDAIEIYPECEGRWKEVMAYGFIFIRGRFRMFSAADKSTAL
jgi:hypothetical protein